MSDKIKAELMKLADDGVSFDEMLTEAAMRMIEYAKEENIATFSKISTGRLLGYMQII